MDKKKLWILIGGFVAVVLLVVLLVGMIDGFWPWNGSNAESDSTGMQTEEQTGDTEGSEDTTVPGTTGTEDTTAPESTGSTDPTKETTGKGGTGGNTGGNGETEGKGGKEDGTEPTETTVSTDVSIGVDVDTTEPSGNGGSFEIDFDDLLG